uniref:Uncharacterized protein n=1 Tax=Solanum tuberosum TaxID=4113 RepID=M1DQR9_SOLTU
MGDPSVEPSSSIGLHTNKGLGLMSKIIIVGDASDSTTSSFAQRDRERGVNFARTIESSHHDRELGTATVKTNFPSQRDRDP